MTQSFSTISVVLQQNSARITLNNPPLNVITPVMMDELNQALANIEANSDISVIVLDGKGSSFSAGVAIAAHSPDNVEAMLSKFHAVIRTLMASKKITVSKVRGNCLGGGAELAMVCDLSYTGKRARWAFPEISLGCYPPVACAALAALIGQKRATELILTGRTISGSDAATIGLVTRVVPEYKLDATVEAVTGQLSKFSSSSLSITKKAIYAWDAMHFDKGLARAEKIYLEELIKTTDAQEGINAFQEKRKPNWMGK
ncbi:MAG TPA: enoyl-CoA hydratase/isomerase family protein [Terriglobales bacterium]|nr:enoyl-CoA hydratase/isomerase family protein [Terriglobales bacterium]